MESRFLVATDGSPSADGALRVARELVRGGRGTVEVVSVVEPAPRFTFPTTMDPAASHLREDARRIEERAREVARQVGALGPEAAGWRRRVVLGSPGPAIAEVAAVREATMILVGLRPHGAAEGVIRSETALGVIHRTRLPVLAVPPPARSLPRRVLVAIDFQGSSVEGVESALPLLGERATIHLAHVAWPAAGPGDSSRERERTYRYGAASRLEEIAARLWTRTQLRIETHVEVGDPEEELLALADRLHAELVVAGSHGPGALRVALTRGVPAGLVRHAPCSVLLTRVPDAETRERSPVSDTVRDPGPPWLESAPSL